MQQIGNVSWWRKSVQKGLNPASGSQFCALPLVMLPWLCLFACYQLFDLLCASPAFSPLANLLSPNPKEDLIFRLPRLHFPSDLAMTILLKRGSYYCFFSSTCRGALKYNIKAFSLAVKDLTEAVAIDCKCSLAYFNRAVCYHEMKFFQKVCEIHW